MNIASFVNRFFESSFVKSLSVVLFTVGTTLAQDSIKVSYSQEADTLVKQRFIDRYENVFMTRIPTRQMFKVSAVNSEMHGTGINWGYEYKLLPALSLEASLYSQLARYNGGLADQLLHFNLKQVSLWVNAKARWYYNMDKRIREGLNANNFSGPYVGFSYEQSLGLSQTGASGSTKVARLGLLYGFQSRFFNAGHIDFAVGLFQKSAGPLYIYEHSSFLEPKDFVIGTQAHIGLAFGDWEKTASAPLCDVLLCDERVIGQWKVEIPSIAVGLKNQDVQVAIGYERKLGESPISVGANLKGIIYNLELSFEKSRNKVLTGEIDLRYYFLRNFQLRRGKGASNFSGPYAGLRAGYTFGVGKLQSVFYGQNGVFSTIKYETATSAVALGYQQRLFKRIYFDGSLFYQKRYKANVPGGNKPFLSSKMAIGFTF
ncbi:MAG: hypothetical protein ABIN80_17660 [Dyadobacter sp.]|uniref:hypothetical protein n=1 Tax=Dyadobacter sp. TaxID=1914288 RepID=UPI003267D0F5